MEEGLREELLEQHMLAVPSAYTSGLIGVGVAMPTSGLNLEPSFVRHQHQVHSTRASGGTRFRDNNVVVVEGNDHHHQLHLMSNHHAANNDSTMSMSSSSSATSGITNNNISDSAHMRGMYAALGQLHSHAHAPHAYAHSFRTTVPSPAPSLLLPHQQQQPLHSLQPPVASAVAQPPGIRPRVRARRGQATDPHSIAERLRRERIAERMKALQELVPTANKTDRTAMLDEIVDYVKFLRLQVKVLSMSRLGGAGAGAFAQLVADVPLSALEGEDIEGGSNQQVWSNDGIEQEVAKLMEEDIGAAMQFLQSKALCIMPVSLAPATLCTHQNQTAIHRTENITPQFLDPTPSMSLLP